MDGAIPISPPGYDGEHQLTFATIRIGTASDLKHGADGSSAIIWVLTYVNEVRIDGSTDDIVEYANRSPRAEVLVSTSASTWLLCAVSRDLELTLSADQVNDDAQSIAQALLPIAQTCPTFVTTMTDRELQEVWQQTGVPMHGVSPRDGEQHRPYERGDPHSKDITVWASDTNPYGSDEGTAAALKGLMTRLARDDDARASFVVETGGLDTPEGTRLNLNGQYQALFAATELAKHLQSRSD